MTCLAAPGEDRHPRKKITLDCISTILVLKKSKKRVSENEIHSRISRSFKNRSHEEIGRLFEIVARLKPAGNTYEYIHYKLLVNK